MLVLTAGIVAVSDGPTSNGERPASFSAPLGRAEDHNPNFGGTNKEDAGLRLFFAWKNGNRDTARSVARTEAVNDLFARPPEPSARYLGCGLDANGYQKCAIWTPADLVLLGPEVTDSGKAYVGFVESASHGSFNNGITSSPSN